MKLPSRFLMAALITLGALAAGAARASSAYYQPTASIPALKAYGTGSPGVAHAVISAIGLYDWNSSCPGTPDDTVYVAATGLGSGCWVLARESGFNQLTIVAQNTTPPGLGALSAVPSGTSNGTALGSLPSGAIGARFYLGSSDSVTFTIASTAPGSPPAQTYTISGASGGTGPNWDENLAAGEMVYVTATGGSPKFRWF